MHSMWRAAWPGLLLATVLLLPFLGRAHTLDDVTFLMQAKHVLTDPLHPTAFEMVADGQRIRLSSKLVTGPLMAWLLVPCVALGGTEWVAHGLQWLLVLVTVIATVRIADRATGAEVPAGVGHRSRSAPGAARVAGLLVAGCPAVIGMATTSMSDVAAMAFAGVGIERFLAWADERRPLQGVAATLAFAAAGLARSHALAMPLVAAVALVRKPAAGRRRGLDALPLVASWAVAFAIMRLTADPAAAHGSFLDAVRERGPSHAWRVNLAGFGAHWLAAIPLALPWLWARAARLVRDAATWAVFAAAVAFLLWADRARMPIPLAVATALAFVTLADVVLDAWRRGDRDQLLLGAWLLPALAALPYVHLPAKFVLVSAPAAAVLSARLLERRDARLPAPVAGAVVAAGAVLGVLIVLADAEFADAGRLAARRFIAPRVHAGEHVRFHGAWGAQWYAIQAGAEVAALGDPPPAPGTILVLSAGTPGTMPSGQLALEPLDELDVTSHFGQVMSMKEQVGFYSNWYGYLPWTWRNGLIERIVTWRVHAPEPTSPQAPSH
jgi:hypothetical protein